MFWLSRHRRPSAATSPRSPSRCCSSAPARASPSPRRPPSASPAPTAAAAGAASGLVNTFHQLGTSLGLGTLVTVGIAGTPADAPADPGTDRTASQVTLTGASVMLAVALVLVVALVAAAPDRPTHPSRRRGCGAPPAAASPARPFELPTPVIHQSLSHPRRRRHGEAHARLRQLEVSAIGFGCMGMSQSFGPNPGDRDEMIALLRDGGRARRHLLRHRRGLRPVRQRGARRRGPRDPSATRSSSPPSSGSRSTSTAARPGCPAAPTDPPRRGRVAAAARRRHDRPALPAPRRPGRADRGRRRHRRGAHRGRQGAPLRPVRGRCRAPSAARTPCSP